MKETGLMFKAPLVRSILDGTKTPDSSEVVSEEELIAAFRGTNFGTTEHRHLLHQAVLKKACGYHCGHTITMIMRDLGLICKKEPLLPTRKGRDLMRIAFREQMMEGP
ncbi:hypothetical protein [Comamonas sp.]|uniref:hypothetical protein n=2 Tax=Comamonas sp. TaxID=34028 RepID=UPI002FCBC6D4